MTSTATRGRFSRALLGALVVSALGAAAMSLAGCGDDDGGGADGGDDAAACQAACDAEYADDAEGCDACQINATFLDGNCSCEFLSCVQALCVQFCEEHDAGAGSPLCYLDTCTCG